MLICRSGLILEEIAGSLGMSLPGLFASPENRPVNGIPKDGKDGVGVIHNIETGLRL